MPAFEEAVSAQFGRHLVATNAISPGQAVLEHQPYAAVLYDDQVPQRCDWCGKAAQPGAASLLQRCTRCKFVHYDCKECQKAAWKAYHKQECAALVACAPHVPPATVRLAARVLWRKSSEPSSTPLQLEQQQQQQQPAGDARLQQQLAGGVYADVEALLSHWQLLDDARKLQYAQMAALTREFMQPSTQQLPQQPQQQEVAADGNTTSPQASSPAAAAEPPDVRQIALLLARFACNNHTICDDELRPIGVGIYPLGALVNHDCTPNCVQTFAGRKIVFRSVRLVPAGQQLTISYIELAATRQERRRQLLEQYFFDIDHPNNQKQQQQQQQQQEEQGQQQEQRPRSMQDSGLHKLRLLVQPPQLPLGVPAQQQCSQQELLLWSKACSPGVQQQQSPLGEPVTGTTAGSAQGTASSTSSSSSKRPPWPEDAADAQLCQMLLLRPAPGGSSSQQQQQQQVVRVRLPGGMCLLPKPLGTSGAGDGSGPPGAAAAALLQGFFKDLEQLGGADAPEAVDLDSSMLGEPRFDQSQQQQQQQFEAVQWGDWGSVLQPQLQQQAAGANSNAEGLSTASAQQLVLAGAGLLLHVQQLQQQAEALTRQGRAAAAVQVCQAALLAADGTGPLASVQEAPHDAAAAATDAVGCSMQGLHVAAGSNSSSSVGRSVGGTPAAARVALGPQHVLRIRLLAALLVAAVDAAEWQLALQAARQLTPLYQLVYPKVWPNLGLHYALQAKLEMLLEQPAAAAAAAEAALAILRVTHGSSSAVLQEVGRTRYEAGQELAAAAAACRLGE